MRLALLIVFSFTLIAGVTASAQQVEPLQRPRQRPAQAQSSDSLPLFRAGPTLRGITITEAQRVQITQIRAKYYDKMKAARQAARPVNPKGLEGAKPIDLTELRTQENTEVRAVLLEEQRPVFDRNIVEWTQQISRMKTKAKLN